MLVPSSTFKCYIHDGADVCRLQLLGTFSAVDVPELAGCWNTVKTTLDRRQVVIDVSGLEQMDEEGQKWINSLTAQGVALIERQTARRRTQRMNFFRRVVYSLTGYCRNTVESPTQAQ